MLERISGGAFIADDMMPEIRIFIPFLNEFLIYLYKTKLSTPKNCESIITRNTAKYASYNICLI